MRRRVLPNSTDIEICYGLFPVIRRFLGQQDYEFEAKYKHRKSSLLWQALVHQVLKLEHVFEILVVRGGCR